MSERGDTYLVEAEEDIDGLTIGQFPRLHQVVQDVDEAQREHAIPDPGVTVLGRALFLSIRGLIIIFRQRWFLRGLDVLPSGTGLTLRRLLLPR